MGLPRRRVLAVVVSGGAVLLLGTAVIVGLYSTGTAGAPEGLAAEIDQRNRLDETAEVMPVLLRNSGDGPVTITRLELVAPSVVTEPEGNSITVRPGWTRRIRLPLKPSRCPVRGAPPTGPAAVVMTVTSSGNADRDVRLPAPDPENELGRLAREDCEVQRLLRVTDIGFGGQWRRATDDGEPLLRGDLVIARRAARPAMTVTGIRGNVIFGLRPSSEPPWRLGVADRRRAIPVEVTVRRCDLHALIEVKKIFVFSTWAKLAGEDEQYLELRLDPGAESQLRQLVADTCQPS